MSTSSAHIRVHFATATHNQDLFLQKHGLSPEWSDRLVRMMVLLILTRGYAFSLIDDPIIQETIPNLMHSKKLKRYTSELAGQVRDSVRRTLKRCEYCSLTVDEWADLLKRRYLGFSVHTMIDNQMTSITVAHVPLDQLLARDGRDHVTAKDIADVTKEVIEKFEIGEQLLVIVTDRAASMKAAIETLNQSRVENRAMPILWGNCVCHALNSILMKLVVLLRPALDRVFEIERKLRNSEVFVNFLIRKQARQIRIPSYSEVRWYSLFKMIRALNTLKPLIIEFYLGEDYPAIDENTWNLISWMLPVTEAVKTTTQALESEELSTICFILQGFRSVYDKVRTFASQCADFNAVFSQWDSYYRDIVDQTKRNWHPLLEVACFLHPSLQHGTLLNTQELECVTRFLLSAVNWVNITRPSAVAQTMRAPVRRDDTHLDYELVMPPSPVRIPPAPCEGQSSARRRERTSALASMMSFVPGAEDTSRKSIHDELAAYRAMCRAGKVLPVSFWNEHAHDLPQLHSIAQKVMSVIPSSAATERQFSLSKRLQGLHRCHMSDDLFEDQVLLSANVGITTQIYDMKKERS